MKFLVLYDGNAINVIKSTRSFPMEHNNPKTKKHVFLLDPVHFIVSALFTTEKLNHSLDN